MTVSAAQDDAMMDNKSFRIEACAEFNEVIMEMNILNKYV